MVASYHITWVVSRHITWVVSHHITWVASYHITSHGGIASHHITWVVSRHITWGTPPGGDGAQHILAVHAMYQRIAQQGVFVTEVAIKTRIAHSLAPHDAVLTTSMADLVDHPVHTTMMRFEQAALQRLKTHQKLNPAAHSLQSSSIFQVANEQANIAAASQLSIVEQLQAMSATLTDMNSHHGKTALFWLLARKPRSKLRIIGARPRTCLLSAIIVKYRPHCSGLSQEAEGRGFEQGRAFGVTPGGDVRS